MLEIIPAFARNDALILQLQRYPAPAACTPRATRITRAADPWWLSGSPASLAPKRHSCIMRPVSPLRSGMIVELYPNAEENPAHSRVLFRETVIFHDHRPSRPGSPPG